MPDAPAREYTARLERRRTAFDTHSREDVRLSAARLVVFATAVALAAACWRFGLPFWWLAIPVVAFGWLLRRHDAVLRAREAAARGIAFYERGLARIGDRWMGTGQTGERFRTDAHLYANDLDVFGRGSLFELLSSARTRSGESTLARWLLSPAPPAEIAERRQAVEEIAPSVDLRERVALAGTDVGMAVHPEALVAWASRPPLFPQRWLRGAAVILTAGAVTTLTVWAFTGRWGPFALVALLQILYSLPLRGRIDAVLHASGSAARDLDVLARVLSEIEAEPFVTPRLRDLQRRLEADGHAASALIGRLHRLVERHDWQHNPFFGLLSPAVLWGTHVAFAIEDWRGRHGAGVSAWLEAAGDFEALASLAAYHFEHPKDPFPVIADGPPSFEGEGLGHPLIPSAQMVRNDVRLSGTLPLLVVSGSNMSGKSTLLRTVGVNAVLAFAGAPVRASSLRLTPLAVGATLRIQDSLQEGRSRFYAEITRLRELADLASGPPPLLFLLDELLHGTNSHDRLIGATGVLRGLLDRGAIGLVTTHDLALTQIGAEIGGRAVNVHFEDRLEAGTMVFDYRMKPGPVTRSNALALMRAVGLDVEGRTPAGEPARDTAAR